MTKENESITPRHEAPAEGAGELIGAAESIHAAALIYEDQALLDDAEIVLKHLRARSSAPEAREEALGNLLAVIHGDGGHRALEVGTKQAALEAEKIVAGLFAAPSADKLRGIVQRCVNALDASRNGGEFPDFEEWEADARQALAALEAEG